MNTTVIILLVASASRVGVQPPLEHQLRARRVNTPDNQEEIGLAIQRYWAETPLSVTYQFHDLLESAGFPVELIPKHYLCPITRCLIDKTPVFTTDTPDRFNRTALTNWLQTNKNNPITRRSLSLAALQDDFLLEGKIKVFVHWAITNTRALNLLSPTKAQHYINIVIEKVDKIFAEKLEGNYENNVAISHFVDKIIGYLTTITISQDASKTLALNKEENSFSFAKQKRFVFFQRLNLSQESTPKEIEKAFRHLARTHHPDKNPSPGAEQQFKELLEAKNFLLNGNNTAIILDPLYVENSPGESPNFKRSYS
ncbi:DnaJ domain-containing protein [Legionella quinlivanii]|nr:DnaJ domain-containing protein [Legionella quinlivanii]